MAKRYSIIGCQHAHITMFIEEMQELGYTCAGVYEKGDRTAALRISERYGIPFVEELEDALLPEVSIVGSSGVNSEKIDIVELCERRGKHVMLDKPAATDRSALNRLAGVMERGQIRVGMLLSERFRPATQTLKRMIEAGELGSIVNVSFRKPHRLRPESRPIWFFDKQKSGGIIIDLLVHDFDLIRWLTGKEVVSLQSIMTKTILPEHPTFYDAACAQLQLEGGAFAQMYADWYTPDKSWTWGDCRIFVSGTKGCAELRLNGDPSAAANDELLLSITAEEAFARKELDRVTASLSADFVGGLEGKPTVLSQHDVWMASLLAIEADERAEQLDNTGR